MVEYIVSQTNAVLWIQMWNYYSPQDGKFKDTEIVLDNMSKNTLPIDRYGHVKCILWIQTSNRNT